MTDIDYGHLRWMIDKQSRHDAWYADDPEWEAVEQKARELAAYAYALGFRAACDDEAGGSPTYPCPDCVQQVEEARKRYEMS